LPDIQAFADPASVERVIFCTGKVFYDLCAHRKAAALENAAILRIEQLYPFHREMLEAMLSQYPKAGHFVWCQEEPANMGAWTYLAPLLETIVGGKLHYAGRAAAASPAAGSKAVHFREQKAILSHAFAV
jgi:2-oxoglutarate dehydrogenase E1 component